MIYLAEFELERYDYPDGRSSEPVLRLVDAANADEVEAKLKEHYRAKSSDYAVSFYVKGITVHPTIT